MNRVSLFVAVFLFSLISSDGIAEPSQASEEVERCWRWKTEAERAFYDKDWPAMVQACDSALSDTLIVKAQDARQCLHVVRHIIVCGYLQTAQAYLAEDSVAYADSAFDKASMILKDIPTGGSEWPAVGVSLHELGIAELKRGSFRSATEKLKWAVQILRSSEFRETIIPSISANYVVQALMVQQKHAEAMPFIDTVLTWTQSIMASRSQDTLNAANLMFDCMLTKATLVYNIEHPEAGDSLLAIAIGSIQRHEWINLDSQQVSTLTKYCSVLESQGKGDQAKQLRDTVQRLVDSRGLKQNATNGMNRK